ncbi:MAG: hypothetical protein AB7P03_20075 [Kofleriaceae bacterium]
MSRTKEIHDGLEAIEQCDLSSVTGGRVSRTGADPMVLEGLKQLAEAISMVGQNMAQAKAASGQQMAQMMMQMMPTKNG